MLERTRPRRSAFPSLRRRAPAIAFLVPLVLAPSMLAAGEPVEPVRGAILGSLLAIELAEARSGPGDGQAILDGLRSPEARVRARAARAAGRFGDQRWGGPLPLLLAIARSDEAAPARREAIFALGQIGDPSASEVLSALLLDPSAPIRERALEALAKLAGTPPELIVRFLGDPAPEARGAAALALARLLSPAPGAPPAGIDRTDAEGPVAGPLAARLAAETAAQVRWKLAYLASRRPGLLLRPEVRSRLTGSLKSPSFLEVTFAAAAFGAAASHPPGLAFDPLAMEALEQNAGRREQFWIARVACVRAISDFNSLLPLADSPQLPQEIHHFRRAVIESAAPAGPRGIPLLKRIIETGEGGDLEAAIRAAAKSPELLDAAAKRLLAMGPAYSERLRAALAAARAAGGDPADFLADPSPRVRAAAVLAAAHPSKEFVVRALADPDPSVRGTAADRLATGEVEVETEDLARALRDSPGGEFWEVRAALVAALARKAALPALRSALWDPHPTVVRRAREALARAGDPPPPPAPAPAVPAPAKAGPDFFSVSQAGFSRNPRALIEVRGRGEVRLDLLVEEAPQTVSAFAQLARKGFYDGSIFHRVVSNWVVQGGDPRGTGFGDGGIRLRDETGPEPFLRGSVGIAKLDRDDGGCQFFITHLPAPRLDGRYTLFARVIDGMEVVDLIEEGDAIGTIRIEGWKEPR